MPTGREDRLAPGSGLLLCCLVKGILLLSISDTTMRAVEYALSGLDVRGDVRAHNIANVNTPGFRAMRVEFEGALREALDRGDVAGADAPTRMVDPNLQNGQGNTVSLENELVGLLKDNLLRDALVNSFNNKAGLLRTAIAGR